MSARTVHLAEIFTAAADYIDGRVHNNFVGGPDLWSALHQACSDLVAGPASEQLRRMTEAKQLQFWRGTQREAVALLRAAADAGDPLGELRKSFTDHALEEARRTLCEAMGWGDNSAAYHLENLVCAVAAEVKRLRAANERLEQEARNRSS